MNSTLFGFLVCGIGFLGLGFICWIIGKVISIFSDRVMSE